MRAEFGEPTVEFHREECVRRLGPTVGNPRVVLGGLEVRIVEVHVTESVTRRTQRDHPRVGTDRRQQLLGQQEVADVVGTDLHLEAIRRGGAWTGHDARVIDQHVDAIVVGEKLSSERTNARE